MLNFQRLMRIVEEAISLPEEKRFDFVRRECEGDEAMQAEARKLIGAELGGFLEKDRSPADPSNTASFVADVAERSIIAGRYALIEKLGEGGMGEVWVAKQSEPIKRKVALKLIKKGMDSKSVLTRFEQERQALAVMDHPNIAKVLDGGLTATGQPFFVMELVAGKPVTKFCDEAKLGIMERLELFVPICQAVQHAHQKGIIHRDLKPANILVTMLDGKPTPKVIDFGVAKAATGKLTEETLSTQFGAVVGTLEYMSPEQAGLTIADVDTRSDIYSLGVILYELLTGLRPFDSKRLRSAAFDEMIRIIREEDPPSLSSRLSTDVSLPSIAAMRGVEPKRLVSMVKGELGWIVQRCLEKDRNRRYETANGVVREIQRYLSNEPVEARPTSASYRLRKFVSRHKGAALAGTLLVAALVLGIAGTSWQAFRATRAEASANKQTEIALANEGLAKERLVQIEEEQKKTLAQKSRAEANEQESIRERETAVAVRRFLQDDLLGQGNPWRRLEAARKGVKAKGKSKPNPTIQELVDQAADRVIQPSFAHGFQSRPHVYAEIAATVADACQAIERYDRAIALFDAAVKFGAKSPAMDESVVLSLRGRLAVVYFRAHRFDRVAAELVEILAVLDRNTDGRSEKFDLGLRQLDELLAIVSEQLLNGPTVTTSEISIAQAPQLAFRLLQAAATIDRVQKSIEARLGRDERRLQILRMINAFVVEFLGRKAEALAIFEASLRGLEQSLGPFEMWTRLARMNVIRIHVMGREPQKAMPIIHNALARQLARDGDGSYEVAELQIILAGCLKCLKRPAEALEPLQKASATLQELLGDEHPTTIYVLSELGYMYQRVGRYKESLATLERAKSALADRRDLPGTVRQMVYNNLAMCYGRLGRYSDAVELLVDSRQGLLKLHGPDYPPCITVTRNLASSYVELNQLSKALPLYDEASRAVEKRQYQYEFAAATFSEASAAFEQALQFDKAEALRRKWAAEVKRKSGDDSPAYAAELALLGLNLHRQNKSSEAESSLRECLAIRSKAEVNGWQTFNTQSMLGGVLLSQKNYAEAEPLLLKGYEGMKEREKLMSPQLKSKRLGEAVDRLIELYTTTNKPAEVAKWKAERLKYQSSPKNAEKK